MAVSQCAPPSLDTDGTSSGNFHSTVDWSMLMDSLLWVFSALDGLLEYSLYRSCSTPAVGMLVAGSWSPWRESTSGNPSSCFPVLVNSSILTSNSTNQFHQPSAELECIWILSAICSVFLSAISFYVSIIFLLNTFSKQSTSVSVPLWSTNKPWGWHCFKMDCFLGEWCYYFWDNWIFKWVVFVLWIDLFFFFVFCIRMHIWILPLS